MEMLPVSLLQVLAQTLQIYSLVLIVRVLLSWFPNLDWSNPVLSSVSAITDPYLNAFRGLIPPLGGIDLSALLAFLALNLLQSLVISRLAHSLCLAVAGNFGAIQFIATWRSSGNKSSSSSAARVLTGAENPRALAFFTTNGPGVPAGTVSLKAKG